jgi:hypothetical protein
MALQLIDITNQGHRKIFIYGSNGMGKTHLAMTMPGKKLLINYSGNIETCLKFPRAEYDAIEGPIVYNELVKLWTEPDLKNYQVLILDNVTGLSRELVLGCMRDYPSGHIGQNPNKGDYGLAAERLRLMLTAFAAMSKTHHVIGIAHERLEKDEDSGRLIGNPSVPGQVPAHIMSIFTEIIYMKADGAGERYAHLRPAGNFPAATRLLDPTKVIKNPNLAEMYKGLIVS